MPNRLSQFWQELKRRKVLPFLIGYVAACFAIIEFSTITSDTFSIPENTVKLIYIIATIGLPVVIILPWFINRKKPEAINDELDAKEPNLKSDTPATPEKSIIVLPFENISPDSDQEYFSDGLTEEIITDLSHINDLLVISRSSAMTFKGTKKKAREIASDVNVRYVLEGSVRKAGNNLKIVAQLIDGTNDSHIWAEKYHGTLEDTFDIQENVSRTIVDALKLKLSPEENRMIAEHSVDNIQVYECYLKAIQDLWKYTEDSLSRAEQNLKNGLTLLGDHEILYTGLGQVYFQFNDSGIRPEEEYLDKLKDCIHKVFTLNANSANGYKLLGLLKMKKENSHEAYREFKRAYELNPSDPETLLWLFYILCFHLGQLSLVAPLMKKVMEIDPLTPVNNGLPGYYYFMEGDFNKALMYAKKWYEMEPDSVVARWYVGLFMALNKEYKDAFIFIDNVYQENPEDFFSILLLILKFSLQKKRDEALALLTEEIKKATWNDFQLPWYIADCYALIDEKEQSLKWIERAIEWGLINYPFLSEGDPFLENIREEERFKKLMKKVKHEWENFEV